MEEVLGEVAPGGVGGADEFFLFFAGPAFEAFFPGDGVRGGGEGFAVDEAVEVILGGEAFGVAFVAMFEETAVDVVGDANVEDHRVVGEDVDEKVGHLEEAETELIL